MIERDFDIPFVAAQALREKQIQQSYRPIIGVHKWFARRPGTLFRGLLLAEFANPPLADAFYHGHQFDGLQIADPFMGGGTPLLEANRLGCDVIGYDINPMAHWIVRREIEHLDLDAYKAAVVELTVALNASIGHLYQTTCTCCGAQAPVKYFLWVKLLECTSCRQEIDLFPGYRIAKDARHPHHVLVCPSCGHLNEVDDPQAPGTCAHCAATLYLQGPARRSRCACPACGTVNTYPAMGAGPPRHRLFALEYHCAECRPNHQGRFFKQPDAADLAKVGEAEASWRAAKPRFVPEDEILAGDESDRLHRWGYRCYRELFNPRQLLGLESSARIIDQVRADRVKNALATNLSDLLRYQNMLCRYDAMALKSLDIFSVHGFPVGLLACESNLMGIHNNGRRLPIGSGGWANITQKYIKAKAYCDAPFEVRTLGKRKVQVPIDGEWIGDRHNGNGQIGTRRIELHSADAAHARIQPGSLDAVFTDPPYFGNVQYAELMDFCYVWLRRLVGRDDPTFSPVTTRSSEELTVNENMGRDGEHFTDGISRTFVNMATALKAGRPLAFTYHHNRLDAYYPIAVAILDAGLVCTASLPCPAEMSASIHISGTGSSVVDSVFVCRSTGTIPRRWIVDDAHQVADLVEADLEKLRAGGLKPSLGDIRCIVYGHLIRLAIWRLRTGWDQSLSTRQRLDLIEQEISTIGIPEQVEEFIGLPSNSNRQRELMIAEAYEAYGSEEELEKLYSYS